MFRAKKTIKHLLGSKPFLKRLLLDPYVEINYYRVCWYYALRNFLCISNGTLGNSREPKIIISLTTIPERLPLVHLCIETLLNQSTKPDLVILWLANALKQDGIPAGLKRLQRRGLSIKYCEDLRSYKKLIPALGYDEKAIIVTADDDFFYPKNWLDGLVNSYREDPEYIHCYRAHYIRKSGPNSLLPYKSWDFESPNVSGPSFNLMPTTGAGCLFPPGSLDPEVMNKAVFMKISPTADDIWFKAMSLKKGIMCKKVNPESRLFRTIRGRDVVSLWSENQYTNNRQAAAVFGAYDLYGMLD